MAYFVQISQSPYSIEVTCGICPGFVHLLQEERSRDRIFGDPEPTVSYCQHLRTLRPLILVSSEGWEGVHSVVVASLEAPPFCIISDCG